MLTLRISSMTSHIVRSAGRKTIGRKVTVCRNEWSAITQLVAREREGVPDQASAFDGSVE